MSIVPRQQVIPFTVMGGQTLDLTAYTKYDHSKVLGVVLLPNKSIFGDHIYLEINRQTVLPYRFNAGLISFRQFLNKEMKRNVYKFEEWALGNEIRIIYTNNDKRIVNIDMILFTVQGDFQPIEKRKKLQIVPVPYTKYPEGTSFELCEVRTKTDFYFDELIGVFNDHFSYVQTVYDEWLSTSEIGDIIREFLALIGLPPANSATEVTEKKDQATTLKTKIDGLLVIPANVKKYVDAMKKTLNDYLSDETVEPEIDQDMLFQLQESIDSYVLYDDGYQSLSTLGLTVGAQPFYPDNYPIANIVPRYRKSFNETMYRTSMKVKEADIFIRFDHNESSSDLHIPTDFSMYFQYNQTVSK